MKWFLYVEPTQEVVTYLLNSLNANNFRSSSHIEHETSTLPLHKQSGEDEEYETLFANDDDLIIVLTALGDFIVTDHKPARFLNIIIA